MSSLIKSALALRTAFRLDESLNGLNSEQEDQVFGKCLEAYRKSVVEFDKAAAKVAFEHEGARAFASELCRRTVAIIEAHSEVLEDENPSLERHDFFSREFMRKMRLIQILGNVASSSGSVGMNIFQIEKAIAEGNLREQMTLVYKGFFPFMLELLDTPGMIDKINAKLQQLPPAKRFQIDRALFQQHKEAGTAIKDTPTGGKVVVQPAVVSDMRAAGARIILPKRPTRCGPSGLKVREIPELSVRELRAATGYAYHDIRDVPTNQRATWVAGQDCVSVAPTCTFAKEAEALGGLPLSTGSSGTTDAFLHLSQYLSLGDRLPDGALACAGWMVPVGDHTLHEIRVIENEYGMPYSGKPEDFTRYHSPAVQARVDAILLERGFHNPSYYFSPEYQKLASQELQKTIAG